MEETRNNQSPSLPKLKQSLIASRLAMLLQLQYDVDDMLVSTDRHLRNTADQNNGDVSTNVTDSKKVQDTRKST